MIYIELRGRNIFCEGIKSMLYESLVNVIQENHIKTKHYRAYEDVRTAEAKICVIDAEYSGSNRVDYNEAKTKYVLFSQSFNSRSCNNKVKGFFSFSISKENLHSGLEAVLNKETFIDPFFMNNVIELKKDRGLNGAIRYKLTARESDVLQLIIGQFNNEKIADKLGLSENTVKNHVSHILQKMNVKSRNQVILKVRSHSDINPTEEYEYSL